MSVEVRPDGQVRLSGHCASGDAERLVAELVAKPAAGIDWRDCKAAHTAVVQVLLAAGRPVAGPPASPFLARWVEPLLAAG